MAYNENKLTTNPSFYNGTTGWSAIGSTTLSEYTSESYTGKQCLQVTKSTTVGAQGAKSPSATGAASTAYAVSAYVKIPVNLNTSYPTRNESGQFRVGFESINSGGTVVATTYGPYQTVSSADSWVRLVGNGTSNINTATVKVVVEFLGTAASTGHVYLVDAVKIELGSVVTRFVEPVSQDVETETVNKALRRVQPGGPEYQQHLTGLSLQGDIIINDLVLNTIGDDGCVWVCTDIDGWWDLPTSELLDLPRGLDDGSYDVRGRWAARTLTLTGSVLPPTASSMPAARAKLAEALALVYKGAWLLVDEDPMKAAYVRLVGKPSFKVVNARGRIDFSANLKAGDPIKYSWDNTDSAFGYTSSSLAVNAIGGTTNTALANQGNIDSPLVFNLTGPLTAPSYIKNVTTGKSIKIVKDLRPASSAYQYSISSYARSGRTSTITTTAAHTLLLGDKLVIAMSADTSFQQGSSGYVTVTDVGASTFQYDNPGPTISSISSAAGTVTVITSAAHGFGTVGTTQSVYIDGAGTPFDGTYTVTLTSTTQFTYTITDTSSVTATSGNATKQIATTAYSSGTRTIQLYAADTLEIDTYSNSVSYRGIADTSRSVIDANVDWVRLQPGVNQLRLEKSGATTPAVSTVKYRSAWIG